ncbi:hypothetical protein CF328_g8798 [Tilletia controversa]|nr:hypothetical protein CF328_g8798 [Tilletia controversa]
MTLSWLVSIIPVVEATAPKEVAAIAALICGFWGLCRIGELTISSGAFNHRLHVTRTARGQSVLTIRLPRTKTEPFGETIVIPERHPACDLLLWLRNHLSVSPSANPSETALFAYRDGDSLRPMSRTELLATADSFARRVKLPSIYGHSMRIGGCTVLLLMGVPVDKVMMHGRWHGDSFKRYVREHAEILAPFLAVQQGALDTLGNIDLELRNLLADAEAHVLLRARPGVIGGHVPYERDAREQLNIVRLLAPTMGGAHASAGSQSGFRRQ